MFVGMHIPSLQENEVKAGLNHEKESVDAWIEGTLTMKNGVELPAREMKGEARDVLINREEGITTQLITLCCCLIL